MGRETIFPSRISWARRRVRGGRSPAPVTLKQVRQIVKTLPKKERLVIEMRYGLLDGAAHPQHEVAAVLGISRSYVSRMEKRALEMLRQGLETD